MGAVTEVNGKVGETFRVDVSSNTLLHMHIPKVSSHIQIGTIIWMGKMRRLKIDCFRYKRHSDIYVSNVPFSTDVLLSMLDAFPEQKIIVMIESDENNIQALSSAGKSIDIAEVVSHFPVPRFSAACNKMELYCLFNQVNVNGFEGAFIASINNSIIPNELICSVAHIASSMVKCGMSDISLSINFPENQMVISFAREKYEEVSIKDKIYSIFGT